MDSTTSSSCAKKCATCLLARGNYIGDEEEVRELIQKLKEENALLRGVLNILRVDLQVKDDQIEKLYQSLKSIRRDELAASSLKSQVSSSDVVTIESEMKVDYAEPKELKRMVSTEVAVKKDDVCYLAKELNDDLLTTIFSYLGIVCLISIRRVSRKFLSLSKDGMNSYWKCAWYQFKGSSMSLSKQPSSTGLWEQQYRWLGVSGKPVVTTLSGHKGSVTCLAQAHWREREILVSGSDDGSLIIWCTSEGKQSESGSSDSKAVLMQHHHRQSRKNNVLRLQSLNGHHGPIWGVSVHGNLVCSGSFDKTVKIWELSSGNCINTLRGHENWISCVSLFNEVIISGSWDSTVRLWSVAGGSSRHLGSLPTEQGNAVYALDRCGDLVAIGSHRRRFDIFDIETLSLLNTFEGAHTGKTYSVHFQSATTVATGGCDGKAKVWDLRSQENRPAVILNAHSGPVLGVKMGDAASSPYRLATCSGDHLVKVFDIRFSKQSDADVSDRWVFANARSSGTTTLSAHSEAVFTLSMTENSLYSGSADGTIKLFRFDS